MAGMELVDTVVFEEGCGPLGWGGKKKLVLRKSVPACEHRAMVRLVGKLWLYS